jgi:hypothetical protein
MVHDCDFLPTLERECEWAHRARFQRGDTHRYSMDLSSRTIVHDDGIPEVAQRLNRNVVARAYRKD